MSLTVRPITIKAAQRFVRAHHRHLPRVQGGLFAVAVADADHQVRGVAIVGLPVAREDMDGITCEVVRCAVDGAAGSRGAPSMLYARARRVAQLLGYVRCLTKTLPSEGGGSLRALALRPLGVTRGGEWDRPSRQREAAVRPEPKTRWDLLAGGRA